MAILSEPRAAVENPAAGNCEYQILFRRPSDGREFPGNIVSPSAFQQAFHQVLFAALRQGMVDEDADTDSVAAEPIFAATGEEPRQVTGLKVIVRGGERQFKRTFGLELFEASAQTDLEQLAKSGQLGEDRKAVFRVVARPAAKPNANGEPKVALKVRRKPVTLREGSLADWMGRAEPCGAVDDRDFPLFITKPALECAGEYCFKSDRSEGGAMLMGHLFRQWQPKPEIFGVVDAVLELRHARHERFSLTPTPETLADLTRQRTIRQTRLGRPHEVPLVLAHSHDFLPSLAEDGEANCPTCPLRPTCQLVSSFYSTGDVLFHTGLFSKQPWVAGLVFGRTPREEQVIRLFVLEGARTRERGYYLVHDIPAVHDVPTNEISGKE